MALGEVDDGVEVGAAALGGVQLEEDLLGCLGDGLVAEAVLEEPRVLAPVVDARHVKNEVIVRAWGQKGRAMIAAGVDAEWRGADTRWVLLAAT